jgi:hypothetical protein
MLGVAAMGAGSAVAALAGCRMAGAVVFARMLKWMLAAAAMMVGSAVAALAGFRVAGAAVFTRMLAAAAMVAGSALAALADCGSQTGPCEIDSGSYHAVLPEGAARGAIMFLHGFGGSGMGTLGNRLWVPQALAAGYAVIAPDGMPRQSGGGRRWSFHPDWPQSATMSHS